MLLNHAWYVQLDQAPLSVGHCLMQQLVSKTNLKRKIHVFHHPAKGSHLNQLSESFIHLVQNARGITDEIFDGIQVIECDQQDVFGPGTQQDLVLESHSHEIIQLQSNTGDFGSIATHTATIPCS